MVQVECDSLLVVQLERRHRDEWLRSNHGLRRHRRATFTCTVNCRLVRRRQRHVRRTRRRRGGGVGIAWPRHERVAHEPGQLQLHRGRRRLGGRIATSGNFRPDGGDITVSGSCTDSAGNTGSTSLKIKYDGTPPTVAGTLRGSRCEQVVQPSGRRRVHRHGRRLGVSVLADGELQGRMLIRQSWSANAATPPAT